MKQINRPQALLASGITSLLTFSSLSQMPAQSIQLKDGTTYFANVPRLEKARTTFDRARVFGATYFFTLNVPDDAGEPLQRVMFQQQEGVDRVTFNLKQTRAYADEQRQQPLKIANALVGKDDSVSILFDPPIQPGGKVMIGLRPHRNPGSSGVYLFGVTAFPQGEQAYGQFLGYGRLHFYDRFRHPFR